MTKLIKISFQFTFTLIGMVLFINLLREARSLHLFQFLRDLSDWAWAILIFYSLLFALDVWGWGLVFEKPVFRKTLFSKLFWTRLVGESFNAITPLIDVGGEPIKVNLLQKFYRIPKKSSISSILIHRALLLLSSLFFILLGFWLLTALVPLDPALRLHLQIASLIFAGIIFTFVWIQKRGLFFSLSQFFGVLRIKKDKLSRQQIEIDQTLTKFYRYRSKNLCQATFLHFLSWIGSGFETYLMLTIAGVPVTLMEALMLESLVQLARMCSFFIPGNIGVQEGAYAYLAVALGLPAEAGLAISLFKRARQISWIMVGFGIWAFAKSHEKFGWTALAYKPVSR